MNQFKETDILKGLVTEMGEIEELTKLRATKRQNGDLCKCGNEGTKESHGCPYQKDVNNDYDFTCNCCKACMHECCTDV